MTLDNELAPVHVVANPASQLAHTVRQYSCERGRGFVEPPIGNRRIRVEGSPKDDG